MNFTTFTESREKTHIFISIDAAKTSDKIRHAFIVKKKITKIRNRKEVSSFNEGHIFKIYHKHHTGWNIESFIPKIWNVTRIPAITALIQPWVSQWNKTRKERNCIRSGKEEIKLSVCTDDIIIEKSKRMRMSY